MVAASIRRSILWNQVKMYYLHQNMRLEQTPEMEAFAQWLLDVGGGVDLDNSGKVEIPQYMHCVNETIDGLVDEIYPDIGHGDKDDEYFLDRNIMACTNDSVMDLNAELLNKFPGEKHVLLASDSVDLEDEGINEYQPYPVEYLNSLVSSSLPLAHLELKVGCPVMLLRNLDASKGLCNGTRLRVLEIRRKVLKC